MSLRVAQVAVLAPSSSVRVLVARVAIDAPVEAKRVRVGRVSLHVPATSVAAWLVGPDAAVPVSIWVQSGGGWVQVHPDYTVEPPPPSEASTIPSPTTLPSPVLYPGA